MLKRDTRVQIVILQDDKYVLIKHWMKPENRTFWGVPGGGREIGETDEDAAIREAEEETGLKVKLLPYKNETKPTVRKDLYKRVVTFIAEPIGGEFRLGMEPEAETIANFEYELIDVKWQNLYDDDIDEVTKEIIEPVREYLQNNKVSRYD